MDLFSVAMNPEAAHCDNREQTGQDPRTMMTNERPVPIKSKSVICDSMESLSIRYAELLRLRKAVRLAESNTKHKPNQKTDNGQSDSDLKAARRS